MSLRIEPVTPLIGAEVSGLDLSGPVSDQTVQEVRAALLGWKVLFFRDQPITAEDQLRFGRRFGQITTAHPISASMAEYPEVWERSAAEYKTLYIKDVSTPSTKPPLDYFGWHIDITFVPNPAMGSILRGVDIPPHGGDTLWCNMAAVYDGLSPKLQAFVDGLQAVHLSDAYDLPAGASGAAAQRRAAVHPLVRVHPETGNKSLFLSPGRTSHIVGLKARESRALIDLLLGEMQRPEYHVRFRWTPNSLAFWDNRCTAHVGPVDFAHFDAPRVVQRITIAGDLPVGPDGFQSYALEGDVFR